MFHVKRPPKLSNVSRETNSELQWIYVSRETYIRRATSMFHVKHCGAAQTQDVSRETLDFDIFMV